MPSARSKYFAAPWASIRKPSGSCVQSLTANYLKGDSHKGRELSSALIRKPRSGASSSLNEVSLARLPPCTRTDRNAHTPKAPEYGLRIEAERQPDRLGGRPVEVALGGLKDLLLVHPVDGE